MFCIPSVSIPDNPIRSKLTNPQSYDFQGNISNISSGISLMSTTHAPFSYLFHGCFTFHQCMISLPLPLKKYFIEKNPSNPISRRKELCRFTCSVDLIANPLLSHAHPVSAPLLKPQLCAVRSNSHASLRFHIPSRGGRKYWFPSKTPVPMYIKLGMIDSIG